MLKIPLGIADFETIRQNGYFYADKTKFFYQLLTINYPFFLSRPRRFGKSLMVSALEYILKGQRDLFKGLWIDQSDYDWTPQPVIHLSFDNVSVDSVARLWRVLYDKLKLIADEQDLIFETKDPAIYFELLIEALYSKYGHKPAVLIDEYDAPILSQIGNTELTKDIQNTMGTFYGTIKATEKYRGFTFITGITKFAPTSVFSRFNILDDLTFDEDFAEICGFTL
jgi:hypothetical protein